MKLPKIINRRLKCRRDQHDWIIRLDNLGEALCANCDAEMPLEDPTGDGWPSSRWYADGDPIYEFLGEFISMDPDTAPTPSSGPSPE
jgi:hypothetical protein